MSALAIFYALLFYAATLMLVGGLAVKIRSYAKTPAPLLIPTTPAPIDATGVVLRMTREVVFFESLFKASKWTWVFGWLFHASLLLVLLRHLRYFQQPVQALMQRVAAVARHADAEACFDADELIVSAGGSAVFDLVVPGLKLALDRPVQGLLRSGCYITHDHGTYRRMKAVMDRRLGCDEASGLRAALEVWTVVQSVPEPGLAILSAGRRDLSHDVEMPIPIALCPRGETLPRPVPADWTVSGLNDQHAYLRIGSATLQVGDRIGLGISHPCTTFDKWRWMPVVDEQLNVVDAITTNF